MIEYNPEMEGVLDQVLASKEVQEDFLFHTTVPFSIVRPDNYLALEKWYGKEMAKEVSYVEEFEVAEYGTQMTEEDVLRLFPMIGKAYTLSAKNDWFAPGWIRSDYLLQFKSWHALMWLLAACIPLD